MVRTRGLTTGERRRTTWARRTTTRCDNNDEARHDTTRTCRAALDEVGDGTRQSSSPRRGLQGRRTLLDGLLGRGFGRSPWVGAEAAPTGSDRGSRTQGAGVASWAALPTAVPGCRMPRPSPGWRRSCLATLAGPPTTSTKGAEAGGGGRGPGAARSRPRPRRRWRWAAEPAQPSLSHGKRLPRARTTRGEEEGKERGKGRGVGWSFLPWVWRGWLGKDVDAVWGRRATRATCACRRRRLGHIALGRCARAGGWATRWLDAGLGRALAAGVGQGEGRRGLA
jgi:hypothetical protein